MERFFSKVEKKESGCHEWTGCIMPNGYGHLHYNRKTAYAHRVAWELEHGAPPEGFVLHSCDNRKCVNPAHLRVGTFAENMADMTARRRQAHGSRNGRAKLNEETVRAIRQTNGTQAMLAKRFGVSQATISMARSRRTWRYA